MNGPAPKYDVLCFSLWGTLIDVEQAFDDGLAREGGIAHEKQRQYVRNLRRDAEWELLDELEEFRPWADVVAESLVRAASRAGNLLSREAALRIVANPGAWPLFPDARPALERLGARYRIALVGNFGREAALAAAPRLGITPARIVTAADVEAYLPEPDLLLAVLHELELDEDRLLHVSAEPELDLYTAEDLGVASAYVDRSDDGLPEDLTVAFRVTGLDRLAARLLAVPGPRRGAGGGRPRGPVARRGRSG